MSPELKAAGDAVVEAALRWAQLGMDRGVWKDEIVHEAVERYMKVRDRERKRPVV